MATTVHLPPSLLESVDHRAYELGLSRNRYIIRALEHALASETRWSPQFVETLAEARSDDEGRAALAEMTAAIATRRTRKGPPPL
jgi:predicted transcriptional regulator